MPISANFVAISCYKFGKIIFSVIIIREKSYQKFSLTAVSILLSVLSSSIQREFTLSVTFFYGRAVLLQGWIWNKAP